VSIYLILAEPIINIMFNLTLNLPLLRLFEILGFRNLFLDLLYIYFSLFDFQIILLIIFILNRLTLFDL